MKKKRPKQRRQRSRTDPLDREAASFALCLVSCAFDLSRLGERLKASGYTVPGVHALELGRVARMVALELEAIAGERKKGVRHV